MLVLGVALGLLALPLSVYVGVSQRWVRWSLVACGALMAMRYFVMASSLASGDVRSWWGLRSLWVIHLVALTWPAVVAADHLIRHPAVTPQVLARWYAPVAVSATGLILLGHAGVVVAGHADVPPVFAGGWVRAAGALLGGFSLVLLAVGGAIWRRLSPGPVRTALFALMAVYMLVGLEGVIQVVRPSPIPWLWPELLASLALWGAFQTAQRASS